MRIFMIRHEAAENRQMGYSDKDRALTSKGIQAMKEQVKRSSRRSNQVSRSLFGRVLQSVLCKQLRLWRRHLCRHIGACSERLSL